MKVVEQKSLWGNKGVRNERILIIARYQIRARTFRIKTDMSYDPQLKRTDETWQHHHHVCTILWQANKTDNKRKFYLNEDHTPSIV